MGLTLQAYCPATFERSPGLWQNERHAAKGYRASQETPGAIHVQFVCLRQHLKASESSVHAKDIVQRPTSQDTNFHADMYACLK